MVSHSTFAIAAIPRPTSEPRGRLMSNGPVEAPKQGGCGQIQDTFQDISTSTGFSPRGVTDVLFPAIVTYIHYNPCPVAGVVGKEGPEQDTRTSDVDYTGPATGPVTAPTLLGTPDRTTERPCRHCVALIQPSVPDGWQGSQHQLVSQTAWNVGRTSPPISRAAQGDSTRVSTILCVVFDPMQW
ncbi:hypothetical protein QC762_0093030 [Podospora pseudocomata]|uniref:Uncharacterized protein n=1 Tax=Podospora pseudocomata TaxID=2093779 RepID=A0ABR0G6X4_9PEZI|nr:hypothetical protein QC762_0093030 [Podospora pseudocomata]